MSIKYLKVFINDKMYKYDFSNKILIYSKDNSKGKTTLIRFILYALGYQIPATEGIGDFDKLEFEIFFERDNKSFKVMRQSDVVNVLIDQSKYDFLLPLQEIELHTLLFGISNVIILKNLLTTFYMDQEKGWTLLNRGKIIGNIRFNIEEFIAGISEIDIKELLDEKKVISNELKKYRYFKNVIDINSEFNDDDSTVKYDASSMNELMQEQKEIELNLKKVKSNIKEVQEIINNNKQFADMIENYGLIVNHNGEEFILTKKDLGDLTLNQDLLKTRTNMLKVEEEKLMQKYKALMRTINEKNTLFSMDDLVENMENMIDQIGIDVSQIDKIIRQMSNKRNNVNKNIKEKLSFNNNQLITFYDSIEKYAKELGIIQFISDKSPKFVLTSKLKGFSGRVLAQMSYVFKLSYIKIIEEKFGLVLPIIIDSPRTNELSEDSTNDMMKILDRDFKNHQVIMASIYKIESIDFDLLNLDEGLLSSKFNMEINEKK